MVRSSWVGQVGLVKLGWSCWVGQVVLCCVALVGLARSGWAGRVMLVVLGWVGGLIEFDWSSWVGQGEMVGLDWSGC